MSWSALYPAEADRALLDRAQHPQPVPQPEPSFWSKAGALVSAPYTGFAQGLHETARVAYRVSHWTPDIEPLIDWRKLGVDTDSLAKARRLRDEEVDQSLRSGIEYWKPDPLTGSFASNFLHEGARIVTKAAGYGALGGAPGAAIGTGIDEGATQYLSLRDRGVDPVTATQVGIARGTATAVGIALPIAGATKLQTTGLVALGGPGLFSLEQAASRGILERANYPELATEFNEATQATETSTYTLGSVSIAPKTCCAYVEESRQLRLMAPEFGEMMIRRDLRSTLSTAVDTVALNGSGVSGQPTGVMGTTGIGTFTGASVAYAGVLEAQTDILTANALSEGGAVSFICRPAVALLLANRQGFSDTAPMWTGPLSSGTVAGCPALSTMTMPATTLMAGDFSQLAVAEFGAGLEIRVNPVAVFQAGIVGYGAFLSMDVAVLRPEGFSVATGVS